MREPPAPRGSVPAGEGREDPETLPARQPAPACHAGSR